MNQTLNIYWKIDINVYFNKKFFWKLRNMIINTLWRCSFNHKTSNSKFFHRMEKPFHLASSFRVRSSLSNNESRWTKRTHCVSLDFVETSGDRIWFSRANLSITRSPRSDRDSNQILLWIAREHVCILVPIHAWYYICSREVYFTTLCTPNPSDTARFKRWIFIFTMRITCL